MLGGRWVDRFSDRKRSHVTYGGDEGAHDGALGYVQGVNEVFSLGGNLYDPGDLSGYAYDQHSFEQGKIGGYVGGGALGTAALLAGGGALGVTKVGSMGVGQFAGVVKAGVVVKSEEAAYIALVGGGLLTDKAGSFMMQHPNATAFAQSLLSVDPALPSGAAAQAGYMVNTLISNLADD